ncbi:MAG: thermonuclease family protein [Sedimentisphaerales bacterium]|nr:thermonuclease family protein [Sedimentisphaerales bacterium]
MSKTRRQPRALSRRMRTVLIVAGSLGMVLLVWLDRGVFTPVRLERSTSGQPDPAQDRARYHGRTFTVVRVVDGDTLHVNAPDGDSSMTKVRLLGIDAPETNDEERGQMYYAREATQFAQQLACGRSVTLYLDESGRSRGNYGRLLAYVELPDERILNDVLLLEGYAYADLRFRHSRYQRYQQLEATARSLQRGLWAQVKREQLPDWLQGMQPDLLARPR